MWMRSSASRRSLRVTAGKEPWQTIITYEWRETMSANTKPRSPQFQNGLQASIDSQREASLMASPKLMATPTKRLTRKLEARILSEFDGDVRALSICPQFAANVSPEHPAFFDYLLDLIGTARGESRDAWAVRRLAALLLEHQAAIAIRNGPESADALLAALGLKAPGVKDVDRKSTRLNSSHQIISYAVFCLKKKI